MGVSVLFTVIFFALLGFCLFFAWRRSWVRSASSLAEALWEFFGMYGIVWSQVTADVLTVTLSLFVYHRFAKQTFAGDERYRAART